VSPRGYTPLFPCDGRCRHGFHLGQGGATWEHGKLVDLSSLGIICAPERLDDPICKPMESHDNWHKEEREANDPHQKIRHVGPKDAIIDGKTSSFGQTMSAERQNGLVGVTIHEGV
jgi:hypothetical protein